MFAGIAIFVLIALVIVLFARTGYTIWYAKSGRYELDKRVNTVTR